MFADLGHFNVRAIQVSKQMYTCHTHYIHAFCLRHTCMLKNNTTLSHIIHYFCISCTLDLRVVHQIEPI